jgi:hypothetical protein
MAVTNTAAYSGPHTLTNSSSVPFTVQAASKSDLQLIVNGIVIDPGNYSANINGDGTGTLSLSTPLSGTAYVRLNPSFRQEANWERHGPYFPDQIVTPLDHAARRDIFLRGEVDRAIKVPVGAVPPTFAELGETFKGDPGGNAMAVGLFSTISSLTIPAGVDQIFTTGHTVKGIGRGVYRRDTTFLPQNVGLFPDWMTFSADGAIWRLEADSGAVSIEQFGGLPDNATDCRPAFLAALVYFLQVGAERQAQVGGNYYAAPCRLQFPTGPYFFSDYIDIKFPVIIEGNAGTQGSIFQQSILRFAKDKPGFIVHTYFTKGYGLDPQQSGDGAGAVFRNVKIQGSYTKGIANYTQINSGVWLRARARLEGVTIAGFGGHGLKIVAAAGGTAEIEGNANNWIAFDLTLDANALCGIFTQGADANAGYAFGVNVHHNGRWGILDSSFLGNSYYGVHAATNGTYESIPNNQGQPNGISHLSSIWVHDGKTWQVMPGQAAAAAVTAPAIGSVWHKVSDSALIAPTWGLGIQGAVEGGPYGSTGTQAAVSFAGYAEGDQGHAHLSTQTIIQNGSFVGSWFGPTVKMIDAQAAASVPLAAGATPTKAEFDALVISLKNALIMRP